MKISSIPCALAASIALYRVVDAKKVKGSSTRNEVADPRRLAHEDGCELARYSMVLLGDNEIAPFISMPGASASLDFTIRAVTPGYRGCYNDRNRHTRRTMKDKSDKKKGDSDEDSDEDTEVQIVYRACLDGAEFSGMAPDLVHLHSAPLNQNGDVVIDFSDMLASSFTFNACQEITMDLANSIVGDPAWYYLNAHVLTPNGDGSSNIFSAIRAQLRQGFEAPLDDASIAPFMMVEGASGMATIEFFAGGTRACVSVQLEGFLPILGHLHKGPIDGNGDVVIDLTPFIEGTNFVGCLPIEPELAADVLFDPLNYYFNFHQAGVGPDGPLPGFFMALRGNLG